MFFPVLLFRRARSEGFSVLQQLGLLPWFPTPAMPHVLPSSEAEMSAIPDLTSSLADMVEAGVLGTELREGLGPVPEELCESPSPATSWISRARMATSFTKVWLSLKHRQWSRTIRTQNAICLIFIKYKKRSHKRFVGTRTSAEARTSRGFWGALAGCWGMFWLHTK